MKARPMPPSHSASRPEPPKVPTAPDAASAPHAWLQGAYALLSAPQCDGCTACASKCAGDLPLWREEAELLLEAAGALGFDLTSLQEPRAEDAPCPFLDADTHLCRVYAVRPFVCRAFGLLPWLPCPLRGATVANTRPGPPPLPQNLIQLLLDGYTSRPRRPLSQWARCLGRRE